MQTFGTLVVVLLVLVMARAERPGQTLLNLAAVAAIAFILFGVLKAGIIPKIGG